MIGVGVSFCVKPQYWIERGTLQAYGAGNYARKRGMDQKENWGVGSGEWGVGKRCLSPFPTPHSPLHIPDALDLLRHYERRAVLAPQQVIGLTVIDDLVFRGVEFDRTPATI